MMHLADFLGAQTWVIKAPFDDTQHRIKHTMMGNLCVGSMPNYQLLPFHCPHATPNARERFRRQTTLVRMQQMHAAFFMYLFLC